ncbi:MAG TPA: CoA-binding protein [Clostridia bacterium]|nr:CoA-binding protein [Clostridia bacterium]
MPDQITELLKNARTIAVVGLSGDPTRPSYGVSEYIQRQGYRIIPVHPTATEVLGEKAYPSLRDIPEKIDIVNVFRRPDAVPAIVDEVIELKLPALWLQEGVIHEEAAERARNAGVAVVMDHCILKEHRARRMDLSE